jgi:hypothetical protein
MTNEPTPQEAIDKEVLLRLIKSTQTSIDYHLHEIKYQTAKLAKHEELLKIYNNQLNQLN